jgi:hypothetical protein
VNRYAARAIGSRIYGEDFKTLHNQYCPLDLVWTLQIDYREGVRHNLITTVVGHPMAHGLRPNRAHAHGGAAPVPRQTIAVAKVIKV